MTYNIRKGLGLTSRSGVLKDLREAIRRVGADVVFLQEVRGLSSRSDDRDSALNGDQLEFLADTIWTHSAYGQNAVTSQGHHGNAIMSKFPILSHENVNISTNPLEKRGLLHAVIDPGGGRKLDLICLHLDLLERGRRIQVGKLIDRVRSHVGRKGPLLVAGDFNDWRGRLSQFLRNELLLNEVSLATKGRHTRTFPAWLPILPLDRIYFRDLELLNLAPQKEGTWKSLSDHRALLAEFKFS
jgi:endonuclease/exonuclease/phosphatase family metal-dependent hydrolase